jgi:hypothetical protein
MSIRPVIVVVLIILALTLGAATYFLTRSTTRTAPSVSIKAKEAQARTASLVEEGAARRVSLRGGSSNEAREWFVAQARDSGATDLDEEALRSAFETLRGFSAAIGEPEPSGFARWAQGRDHMMRTEWPVDGGRDGAVLRGVYEELTGEPAPPDLTPERFFERLYTMRTESPALRPAHMLFGDRILEMDFAEFTHHADTFDYLSEEYATEGLGMRFWHGGSTGMGVRMWDPPRSLEEIIEDAGVAKALRVRFILELAGGKFMIFVAEMVFDPALRQWHIHKIWQNNGWGVLPHPLFPLY